MEVEAIGILDTHFVYSSRLEDGKKFYVQDKMYKFSRDHESIDSDGGCVNLCLRRF